MPTGATQSWRPLRLTDRRPGSDGRTSLRLADDPPYGFFVCAADLEEDELIRVVGTAEVEQIIAARGDLRSYRTFQRQPAHRQDSTGQQLHWFIGTRSGRKSQYARLLAATVDLARVPRPLDRVLTAT